MMVRRASFSMIAFVAVLLAVREAPAAVPFYQGKNIRFVVGAAAGGGYDTYTRAISRHIARHIPGNPSIVVENMAGAGSLIAANYVYNVAKPDGLTVGHFIGGLILQQLLGKPGIEFDSRRFLYIGVPAQDNTVLGIAASAGISSPEQWISSKKVLKFGGVGPGSAADDIPKIAAATIGLPVQIVTGYKGTSLVRLAFNNGEIHGLANSWESFKSTWTREVESGELQVILQATPKRHPDLPKVPLIIDYAKSQEAKDLIEVGIHNYGRTARPYVFPPGTQDEPVRLLRMALIETLRDPEFLADARKAKLDISPLPGEEIGKTVSEMFGLEKHLLEKLKSILK